MLELLAVVVLSLAIGIVWIAFIEPTRIGAFLSWAIVWLTLASVAIGVSVGVGYLAFAVARALQRTY